MNQVSPTDEAHAAPGCAVPAATHPVGGSHTYSRHPSANRAEDLEDRIAELEALVTADPGDDRTQQELVQLRVSRLRVGVQQRTTRRDRGPQRWRAAAVAGFFLALGVALVTIGLMAFAPGLFNPQAQAQQVETPRPLQRAFQPPATWTPQPTPTATLVLPTETRAPTATPLPTETRLPSWFAARTTSGANLRTGPGTAYVIIAALPGNATLQILGTSPDKTWYQVRDPVSLAVGWVLGSLVDVGADKSSIPVITPAANALKQAAPPAAQPAAPPPAAPTPPFAFRTVREGCFHSGQTFVEGHVYRDAGRSASEDGIRVRISYTPGGPIVAEDVTGSHPGRPGYYVVFIDTGGPREGNWWVWAINADGSALSNPQEGFVQTNRISNPSDPGACWRAVFNFVRQR